MSSDENYYPLKDDYVKVFFRSGLVAEGHVVEWSRTNSILRGSNSSLFVINKTDEDIMAFKVCREPEEDVPMSVPEDVEQEGEYPEFYEDLYDGTEDFSNIPEPDLSGLDSHEERLLSLAEMRKSQKEIELEIARRRLNTLEPSRIDPKAKYGYPRISQQSTAQYTRTEDQELSSRNYGRMRAMPRQKP